MTHASLFCSSSGEAGLPMQGSSISPEDWVAGAASTELYVEQKLVLLDVGFAGVSSARMTSKVLLVS